MHVGNGIWQVLMCEEVGRLTPFTFPQNQEQPSLPKPHLGVCPYGGTLSEGPGTPEPLPDA